MCPFFVCLAQILFHLSGKEQAKVLKECSFKENKKVSPRGQTHARLSCWCVQPEDAHQVVNDGDNMPKRTPSGGAALLKPTQTAPLKNTSSARIHTRFHDPRCSHLILSPPES